MHTPAGLPAATTKTVLTLVAAAVALLLANSGLATTLIPPRNLAELAACSDLVVLAVAGDSASHWMGSQILTVTSFEIADTVAGYAVPGELIEVAVPGGQVGDDVLAIEGAPAFRPGRTYLLPLVWSGDGNWHPTMLAYGILELVPGRTGARLLRAVEEAHSMRAVRRPDGEPAQAIGTYREADLLDHLKAVVHGKATWDSDLVSATREEIGWSSSAMAAPAGCAFQLANGKPMRWKTFDSGGTVSVGASKGGDGAVAGGGLWELQQAAAAWSAIPGSAITLTYGGERSAKLSCTSGKDKPGSGDNLVVFGDPCGDIADLADCSGIAAFGGAWASGTHPYEGTSYYSITSLYVVVNNGISCLSVSVLSNLLTHELGHGLGFGHVDDPGALMYPYCCNPIADTDRTCAQYLYPMAGAKPPSAPNGVVASDGIYSDLVKVSWNGDQRTGSYSVWRQDLQAGGPAVELATVLTTSLDDTTAEPGVRYLYTVRARNPFGSSPESAGDEGYRACPAPLSPALSAPSAVASGDPFTVTWSTPDPATAFELEESEDVSFTAATTTIIETTSVTLSYTVSSPKTFYYRVRARLGCGGSATTSSFSNIEQTSVIATTATAMIPAPAALYIPSVAHVAGANDTQWRTDLALINISDTEVSYTIELLAANVDNSAPTSRAFALPAGAATAHVDVLAGVFNASGSAALRVTAPDGSLIASTRTYNLTTQGTYGQRIPAEDEGTAITHGDNALLFPLAASPSRSSGFRTNVGFLSASFFDLHVTLELYRASGERVATQTYTIKPFGFLQASDVYGKAGAGTVEAGFAIARTTTPDGRFFAYASVIDNRSGDPMYVPAQ